MIPYAYFFLFFFVVIVILYYLNFNPFFFMKVESNEVNEIGEVNVSDIEISINELKNLNQYIDNGITNHPPV